ncbi:MAG: dipeptidase [Candidatus Eremiobacterota bacterium]
MKTDHSCAIAAYLDQHRSAFLEKLQELLRIPSVSTQSQRAGDVARCAAWVEAHLGNLGLQVRTVPTEGHPAVVAHGPFREGRPRVLLYGHYDVQPADELDLWTSPPFEPRVTGDRIYARGACDNKGQFFAHVCAVETLLQAVGELPVNLSMLIEGEEEIGSPNLAGLLERLRGELAPDLAVVSDTSTSVKGIPTIHYSLRGIVVFELRLRVAHRDVHSGVYGGTLPNAVHALARMVAGLHDDRYRVTVPGFYDGVLEAEEWERDALDRLPFDEVAYRDWLGAGELLGEHGYSTNERRWFRPTLECNGITGGYQGEGSKTIVPATASAKFSARLVADQDPSHVLACLRRWFEQNRPDWARLDFLPGDSGHPYLLRRSSANERLFEAAREAVRSGFGVDPLFSRHGGAIPVVSDFRRVLGVDTLLLGLGNPDDGIHSPDEKFELGHFFGGIRAAAELYSRL